ncbi:site-specific integrase [Streptomyces sp. MP131-18]|uniref:site-specific integrase n=1 Tax=Streptomyces sp. MP131-18 TaxID=1857892 RepID=UPI0009A1B33B|nr:site-specific integrase [Streptomyces sp. MP131-18]ONK14320.1 site-specific tyrosine recombinase XerC [Streptomyces sp. MP131-18]
MNRPRRRSAKSKTEARTKLKKLLNDHETSVAVDTEYTVEEAVANWLAYGLAGKDPETVDLYTTLSHTHIVPVLGHRKLCELSVDDVDEWLASKARSLSTRTLQSMHSCLNRSVQRAMVRCKIDRNVVALCTVPTGQPGRPSKAITLAQAEAVLRAVEGDSMHAYVVVSLLTGARTEELRPLTWDHVDLDGRPHADPPVPPHISVWHSVRRSGDTKTRKSRRPLALPHRCVSALRRHRSAQEQQRKDAGAGWQDHNLVFASDVGTALDAANVRRAFRRAIAKADGINPAEWTPRELRHSFVSLLSDHDVPVEEIAKLVGHSSSETTERVYRKQIRPVIQTGALTMDRIFGT